MLPIDIQMQIDLSAQHHRRELAAAFEALRESHLSPPRPAGFRNIVFNAGPLFQMTDCTFDVSPPLGIVIHLDEPSAARIRAGRCS